VGKFGGGRKANLFLEGKEPKEGETKARGNGSSGEDSCTVKRMHLQREKEERKAVKKGERGREERIVTHG